MSKITYTTQVLSCPKEIVKELDRLFFNFLWKGRPAKVKRTNVLNTTKEGGLDMIDVETKVASLNLNWFCKYLSDELNPGCKCMFDYWFQQLGGINVIMNCKYNIKNKSFLENKMPYFYYNLIMTFFLLKNYNNSRNVRAGIPYNYRREMIWLNKNVIVQRENDVLYELDKLGYFVCGGFNGW